MADSEWSEQLDEAPPPKKGVPVWVWVLGGGCLVSILLVGACGFFLFNTMKDMLDPEIVWPAIREELHFEERPTRFEEVAQPPFMGMAGLGVYVMVDEDVPLQLQLMVALEPDASTGLEELFTDEELSQEIPGMAGMSVGESKTFEVQGREVRARLFRGEPMDFGIGTIDMEAGPGAFLDLTGEGERMRIVTIQLMTRERELDQDLVTTVLEPFDVWHER